MLYAYIIHRFMLNSGPHQLEQGLPLIDVRARSYADSSLGPECLASSRATTLLLLPLSEGLSLWLPTVPEIVTVGVMLGAYIFEYSQ